MAAPIIIKRFDPVAGSSDEWSAYHAAVEWLRKNGYEVGPMQRGAPTAAFIDPRGDAEVSKWRNLDEADRDNVDAYIHDMGQGRFRGRPVEVVVCKLTSAMEDWANNATV